MEKHTQNNRICGAAKVIGLGQRRLFLIFTITIAGIVAAAPVYVDRTSTLQNIINPPPSHKLSYQEQTPGAELYIGALPVIDTGALRITKGAPLPRDSYAITSTLPPALNSDGVLEYPSGGDGKDGATNTIVIATLNPYVKISRVKYRCKNRPIGIMPDASFHVGEIQTADDYRLLVSGGQNFGVYEIKVYSEENRQENDLTTNDVHIKDTLGGFAFSSLRDRLLHYYDGNRGENWYSYPAKNTAFLNYNSLNLGGNSALSSELSKTSLIVNGARVFTASVKTNAMTGTSLKIISLDVDHNSNTVIIKSESTGFVSSAVFTVLYAKTVNDKFTPIASTNSRIYGPNGTQIITTSVAKPDSNTGFYKVISVIKELDEAEFEIHGVLIMRDELGGKYRVFMDAMSMTLKTELIGRIE